MGLEAGVLANSPIPAKQVHLTAEQYELAEHCGKGVAVIAAEVGNGLKSGFRCRSNQITSKLRWVSLSSRRLDRIRFR